MLGYGSLSLSIVISYAVLIGDVGEHWRGERCRGGNS